MESGKNLALMAHFTHNRRGQGRRQQETVRFYVFDLVASGHCDTTRETDQLCQRRAEGRSGGTLAVHWVMAAGDNLFKFAPVLGELLADD